LSAEPKGSLHRGLVGAGAVRFLAVQARGLAEHVRQVHGLDADGSRVAAEALVANALMSAWIKGDERIGLQIQGEEPRFAFMGDVDAEGGLRARFTPAAMKPAPQGRISGILMAIKSDAQREIYRGMTAIDGQRMEVALSDHLGQSDQVDVLVRIEALLADDGRVRTAGGLVLERLPEAPDHPSMGSAEFAETYGALLQQPLDDLLVGLAFGRVGGDPVTLIENRELAWRCSCSQERIEEVLFKLGVAELTSMLEEDGQAEVSCHFCNIAYRVDAPRLSRLIALHGEQN
jgi:molecular chaperone Hsp33